MRVTLLQVIFVCLMLMMRVSGAVSREGVVLYLTASHSPQGILELYCCTNAKVYVLHIKHRIVAFISEVLLV